MTAHHGIIKSGLNRIQILLEFTLLASIFYAGRAPAETMDPASKSFSLTNGVATLSVSIDSGKIGYERFVLNESGDRGGGGRDVTVETDGDYAIDVFWTDWSAPGKVNNADNAVTFSKNDFQFAGSEEENISNGGKRLNLFFKGIDLPFELEVSYKLDPAAFYFHRRISIRDTVSGLNFLRRIWTLDEHLKGRFDRVKDGGFGQPIALINDEGGSSFWGLEYPASENKISSEKAGIRVKCGEEFGRRIDSSWTRSHWAVEGLAPDKFVKLWFMKYVTRIRVTPAKPFTLYNSWYDLRSPRYPGITPDHVMNQTNIVRIIDLLRKNMIEKHGIRLNAFVLDDGWDKYESDWKLRESTFPNGLKPIVDDLKKTDTRLGLWLGPIGGYSFRNLRVDWMKAHGFETVGDELCLGGKNYSQLFKKRVVDFAKDDGVGYYKWDGIQFSCSQPDHGHPVGIYSRDAILDTLINICRAVREANPHVYLNITSGTWLSPWWVKYANQIWMQGGDYGYADVPSISPRDAAMTYRDLVLYDDFKTNDLWFPIANLMTHGIIKGTLEQLGGKNEPLDRFTNEAVMYFARGVSMWELYVSPDILTEGEWNAVSRAILWAKDRFPVLSNTDMIGGNPGDRKTYGYVHFKDDQGIVAARNPWITPGSLTVNLADSLGFSKTAKSLVLERVYPDRWVSPKLYSSGETFTIPLEGYETAIYEIFPLDSARTPLISDVSFERVSQNGGNYTMSIYDAGKDVRLLNPGEVETGWNRLAMEKALTNLMKHPKAVSVTKDIEKTGNGRNLALGIKIDNSVARASLDLLVEPSKTSEKSALPKITIEVDGVPHVVSPMQSDSKSKWYTLKVEPGDHNISVQFADSSADSKWQGTSALWMSYRQNEVHSEVTFKLRHNEVERPMPPRPLPANETEGNAKLFEEHISLN